MISFGENVRKEENSCNQHGYWLEDGERGRNRTFNLLIKSQLLCQLSYAPCIFILVLYTFPTSVGVVGFRHTFSIAVQFEPTLCVRPTVDGDAVVVEHCPRFVP